MVLDLGPPGPIREQTSKQAASNIEIHAMTGVAVGEEAGERQDGLESPGDENIVSTVGEADTVLLGGSYGQRRRVGWQGRVLLGVSWTKDAGDRGGCLAKTRRSSLGLSVSLAQLLGNHSREGHMLSKVIRLSLEGCSFMGRSFELDSFQ